MHAALRTASPPQPALRLKPTVEWCHPAPDRWILRNLENRDHPQYVYVDNVGKAVIDALTQMSADAVLQAYDIDQHDLIYLANNLRCTGMVEGTQVPLPKKGKLTPFQLLSFRVRLFNPDTWLGKHVAGLGWIWTQAFGYLLCGFLMLMGALTWGNRTDLVAHGQGLLASQWGHLTLPFLLLSLLVVSIHELGHAFTLKHYRGIVPQIGLMFLLLMPIAYTDTTDSYCLNRRKRLLVVGAGVICQVTIAAIALCLWRVASIGSWLRDGSYLLMLASVFTLAINLNPISGTFDGYHLAVALTGIDNLRQRSGQLYGDWFQGRPSNETERDRWILAAYLPFGVAYSLLVMGFLLARVLDFVLLYVPAIALLLLLIWAIYYYLPAPATTATTQSSVTNSSISTSPAPTMTTFPQPNSQFHPQSNSTANHAPSVDQPRLKVVAPGDLGAHPAPTMPNPEGSQSLQPAQPSYPWLSQRWVMWGSIGLAIAAISLIPVPNNVSGTAEVDTAPNFRQTISVPPAVRVAQVHIRVDQRVWKGQPLIVFSNPELAEKVAAKQRELKNLRSSIQVSDQQIRATLATVQEAEAKNQGFKLKAIARDADLTRFSDLPTVQQLDSQVDQFRADEQRLRQNLANLDGQVERYRELKDEGAISGDRFLDKQKERNDTAAQLDISTLKISETRARIAALQKQMRDEFQQQYQPEADQSRALIQSALQKVEQAQAEKVRIDQQIPMLEQELQSLKQRVEELTIRADRDGLIVSENPNLDTLQGQYLPEGAPLFQVADTSQLSVLVKVPQEDHNRVQKGAMVWFRPEGMALGEDRGRVQEVLATAAKTQPHERKTVTVRVKLDQFSDRLSPNMQGTAHIEAPTVPLYQKVSQEFLRLVQPGRFT